MKNHKPDGKKRVSVCAVDRTAGQTGKEHLKRAELYARKTLDFFSLKGELSVAFVDDPEMRELNRNYRNISRTTDVLTFEQGREGLIGDLVISLETARRRAALYGISLPEEIKRLVVHGIAHLAGHMHKKKKEGEKMRAEESGILRLLSGL